jgi:hypothetical protein
VQFSHNDGSAVQIGIDSGIDIPVRDFCGFNKKGDLTIAFFLVLQYVNVKC